MSCFSLFYARKCDVCSSKVVGLRGKEGGGAGGFVEWGLGGTNAQV